MTEERYVGFGERIGHVQALTLPPDQTPDQFRTAVWNVISPLLEALNPRNGLPYLPASPFMVRMATDKRWLADNFAKMNHAQCIKHLRNWLLTTANWHEVYELLESFPRWAQYSDRAPWEARVTTLLRDEFSPYRFAANRLVPITSPEELAAVSQAAVQPGKYALAAEHMGKALSKFNARPQPDYENATKEAASAVESALFAANGKSSSMADAIRIFVDQHQAHPALMESANRLFGYASDREGVRHGSKGGSKPVDFDEAKLVIVSASAWVNFIASRAP